MSPTKESTAGPERKHLSEGMKYTPKVFSALKTQVPQQEKKVLCKPTSLFSREKEGNYIYTKEPSRCLWGTLSRSISVEILAS